MGQILGLASQGTHSDLQSPRGCVQKAVLVLDYYRTPAEIVVGSAVGVFAYRECVVVETESSYLLVDDDDDAWGIVESVEGAVHAKDVDSWRNFSGNEEMAAGHDMPDFGVLETGY